MRKQARHPQFSDKGLVAHYKLYAGLNATAKVFDYSLGGFTGVPAGTDIAPAYPGFLFNGTDDEIGIATGPSSVSTVLIWVKPDDVAGVDLAMNLNDTDRLSIDTGTLTKAGFAGGTTVLYTDGIASTTVTANWHLVGITDTVAKDASSNAKIGNFDPFQFMAGKIGETMLFDRVLTPAEMKSIYELTKWRYPNNN